MGYSARVERAFALANQIHADAQRKGTKIPYVTHLMAVAALVGENGGTEDQVIAALLHDAVEDAGGHARLEQIRSSFGSDVADLVVGLSDSVVEDPTNKPAWKPRKEAYLAKLREAGPRVHLVSCADKVHNARSIVADLHEHGNALWDRFKGGREGSLWYYRTLLEIYREKGHAPERLVRVLAKSVDEMHALASSAEA